MVMVLASHSYPVIHFLAMLLIAIVLASLRSRIRYRYGGSGLVTCEDYVTSLFCWTCAVCQEARHVDQAAQIHVNCCCSVVPVLCSYESRPIVVGPPVMMGETPVSPTAPSAPDIRHPTEELRFPSY